MNMNMNMPMPGPHGHGGYGYRRGLFGCCQPRTQTFTNGYGYEDDECCCLPRRNLTYAHGYGNGPVGMPGQMGTVGFGNNMFGGGFGNGMYGYRRGCLSSLCGGGRREYWNRYYRRPSRSLCIAGTVLGSLVGFAALAILMVFLILQPKSPTFELRGLTVLAPSPNATTLLLAPPVMSSPFSDFLGRTVQATLATRNPNDRVGVIYQGLDVFATYHGTRFTGRWSLPGAYLPRKGSSEWSPELPGLGAMTAEMLAAVEQDAVAGRFFVEVRVEGRARWRVGTLTVAGSYRVRARCPAYVTVVGEVARFEGRHKCAVDVRL